MYKNLKKPPLITILIPTYNEEKALPFLFQRLNSLAKNNPSENFEFLFINDGSTDKTLKMLEAAAINNPAVSYVNLSRNFGKEIGMLAGFDYAKGDACVVIDADLQDPPELISKMIALWKEGYDDVYAKRNSRAGEGWFKKTTSSLFYKILQKISSVPIQKDTGDFRLLDRRCILALQQIRESQRYTKGMFSWIGYNKKEITYDRDPRIAGKTKWNYFKLFNLAIEGITSSTIAPLKLATFFGFIVSGAAFCYLIFIIVKTIVYGNDLSGYPSMMVVILFLGGVQLLSIGIIGEYVGRIFNETKKRPPYLVEKYHSSENHTAKEASKRKLAI